MKVESDRIGALLVSLGIVTALTLVIVALSGALSRAAAAQPADFRQAPAGAIKPSDIREALAVSRGTLIEPSERPAVLLPALFDTGSAEFRPGARELLENVASALASPDLAAFRFAIEWHEPDGTDPVLVWRRAGLVQAVLTANGVPAHRLLSIGPSGQQAVLADGRAYVEVVRVGR